MDCKITSTRPKARRVAMTLIEMSIAVPIICLLGLVAGELTIFGARSFQATANYLEMEKDSRLALDILSRDIRQAQDLTSFSPQALTFLDADGTPLEFVYNSSSKSLFRIKGGQRSLLLQGCDFLQFSIFQRTPIAGTYHFFPCTSPDTAKLVQLRWICSRRIPGSPSNTECIQNAAVVIRKKKGA